MGQPIGVAVTSLQVDVKTLKALRALKGKRTYDEVLNMLLRLVPEGDDEGKYAPEFRLMLLEGQLDILAGRTVPLKQVMREFGVK